MKEAVLDSLNGARFSPKHAAVAGWRHRALSQVEQAGVQPMPEDRVAQSKETLTVP